MKALGEPAQAKDMETLAANVAGLGKLVDAQTHILTALQSVCIHSHFLYDPNLCSCSL